MKRFKYNLPVWLWTMLVVSIALAAFWTVWVADRLIESLSVMFEHVWHALFMSCVYISGYGILMLLLLCANAGILWLHGHFTRRLDGIDVDYKSKPVGFLHVPAGYYIAIALSVLFLISGIAEFSWMFRNFMAWLESAGEMEMMLFVPLGMILIGVGLVVFAGTFLIALLPVPCYFVFRRVVGFMTAYLRDMAARYRYFLGKADGPLIGQGQSGVCK